MTCATCGYPVRDLGTIDPAGLVWMYWCSRCGSLISSTTTTDGGPSVVTQPPGIVERVRAISFPWDLAPLPIYNEPT